MAHFPESKVTNVLPPNPENDLKSWIYVTLCDNIVKCQIPLNINRLYMKLKVKLGGGEIAQSLASLSTKQVIRVRDRLDQLVTERWNSITVLLTRSHQCRRLVKKKPSMCYYVCVIMHVKDPQLSVVRVGHCVPLTGFCLSLYDLHALNRDVNMIQTNKQTTFIYLKHMDSDYIFIFFSEVDGNFLGLSLVYLSSLFVILQYAIRQTAEVENYVCLLEIVMN